MTRSQYRPSLSGAPAVILLLIVLVVLGCIGGGLLWWTSTRRALAADAPGFTLVSGEVLSVKFKPIRRGRGDAGVRHRLLVEYAYEVNGTRHKSSVAAPLAPEFVTQAEGEAWLVECNVTRGGPIDVFYDPARPERAVLMTEPWPGFDAKMQELQIGGWSVLGVAVVLPIVLMAVPGLRRRVLGSRQKPEWPAGVTLGRKMDRPS